MKLLILNSRYLVC